MEITDNNNMDWRQQANNHMDDNGNNSGDKRQITVEITKQIAMG